VVIFSAIEIHSFKKNRAKNNALSSIYGIYALLLFWSLM